MQGMHELRQRRGDQVFHLSLTELAFTVIFLLLLLAGLIIMKTASERDAAYQEVEASRERFAEVAPKERMILRAVEQLRAELARSGVPHTEALLSELVQRTAEHATVERLRLRIEEQNAELTALQEVRRIVQRAGGSAAEPAAYEYVLSTIRFARGIEAAVGPITRGQELEAAAALARDARRTREIAAENANLRGQMSHIRRQAEASGTQGFGLPPCWVDAAGRAERIVDVTILDEGFSVKAAWSGDRAAEVASIPGTHALLAESRPLTAAEFRQHAAMILDWSRRQVPECRHYAQVFVAARDVEAAVLGKNLVYAMFYPAGPELLTRTR